MCVRELLFSCCNVKKAGDSCTNDTMALASVCALPEIADEGDGASGRGGWEGVGGGPEGPGGDGGVGRIGGKAVGRPLEDAKDWL